MIKLRKGNIWECNADCYVIPVNTRGVMGAGIAKQAKDKMPNEVFEAYFKSCSGYRKAGINMVGSTLTIFNKPNNEYMPPHWIFAFTKDHYINPSRLSWVETICRSLRQIIETNLKAIDDNADGTFKTIAIPALGCGLGKLPWQPVRNLMLTYLMEFDSPEIEIYIYEPY